MSRKTNLEEFALVVISDQSINYNYDSIVDSGCSNLIIRNKEKLLNMNDYVGERVMVTSKLPVSDIDKVVLVPYYSLLDAI